MKKFTFATVVFVVFALLALIASATFTYDTGKLNVSEYQILTSTAVVFNWTVNSTFVNASSSSTFNCTVYNLSGIGNTGNYTPLAGATEVNTTNNQTFKNITVTLPEGRHYWYLNCTQRTGTSNTSVVTSTRAFDVDTDYYVLSFGTAKKINFSLDNGYVGVTNLYVDENITMKTDNGCVWGRSNLSHVCMDEASGLHVGFHPAGVLSTHTVYTGGVIQQMVAGIEVGRWNATMLNVDTNLTADVLRVEGNITTGANARVGIGTSSLTQSLVVDGTINGSNSLSLGKTSVAGGDVDIYSTSGDSVFIRLWQPTTYSGSLSLVGGNDELLDAYISLNGRSTVGASGGAATMTTPRAGLTTRMQRLILGGGLDIVDLNLTATNLNVNNSNLYVEVKTERVGLGTNKPQQTLNVIGNANITTNMSIGGVGVSGNVTMFSPDGTQYSCGVQNGGTFKCS